MTIGSYAVNALGQRVSKTAAGVTTLFVYDEQGHLLGEGELRLQLPIPRHSPENETAGEGQQVYSTREVGRLDVLGKEREGAEREEVAHALEARARLPQELGRPRGEFPLVPESTRCVAPRRQDPQPRREGVEGQRLGHLEAAREQFREEGDALLARQLLCG